MFLLLACALDPSRAILAQDRLLADNRVPDESGQLRPEGSRSLIRSWQAELGVMLGVEKLYQASLKEDLCGKQAVEVLEWLLTDSTLAGSSYALLREHPLRSIRRLAWNAVSVP
jgi:hypothetical protein